ncbi:ty3-gypsy retrotransposon protein [Tanacetum coccineum]
MVIVIQSHDEILVPLKEVISTTPVLGLPDFEKTFTVETDASGDGIKLFAIVEAVLKWRQYLLGRRFIIRTDHKSIKELMQQVIQTPIQQKYEDEGPLTASFMALSQPLVSFMEELKEENRTLEELLDLHRQLDLGDAAAGFRQEGGLDSGGYLQPLPTPTAVWEDVFMDFIIGMPFVLVVVDRFSKYAHFATLPTSFNAPKVAEVFVEAVVKHHGIPKTIVSDCDPIFVSKFWTQLFKLSEQYVHAMVNDRPDHWVSFLPWAEYCYNTSYHSSIKMSPYQALYGKVPLSIIPYPPRSYKVAVVEDVLVERDELLRRLRDNLLAAKNRMEEKANLKRHEVEFNVGDKVLVKLQPYRQLTLARRLSHKLAKRYYGSYEILERIGKVAYRLPLPVTSKIHPVFHVSILKPFLGSGSEAGAKIPGESDEGFVVEQPLAVCGSRFVSRDGSLLKQVLVQWAGRWPEDATWEYLSDFQATWPAYDLEDKVISEEGGNDTPGSLDAGRAKRVSVAPKWHKEFVMG